MTSIDRIVRVCTCLVWCLSGCRPVPTETGATVTDSLGIRVVTNPPGQKRLIALAPAPQLEIGSAEGDPDQMLDRVIGAFRLNNGAIVIANRAPPLLRWYGPDRRLTHSAGQVGSGPGEFSGEGLGLAGVWRMTDDSVAAWDRLPNRILVFDSIGQFARSYVLQAPPDQTQGRLDFQPLGFRDARMVAAISRGTQSRGNPDIWRDSLQYVEWTTDGEYKGTGPSVLGPEVYTIAFMQRVWQKVGAAGGPPPPPAPPPPFGVAALSAVGPGGLYHISSERFEISVYEGKPDPSLIVRRPAARQAVTASMKEGYGRELMGLAGSRTAIRRDLRRWLDAAVYPDSLPAYRRLQIGENGVIWVQVYDPPEASQVTWSLFQPDGAWLGDVELSSAMRLLAVGADYVIVLARDEFDAERVRLYALHGNRSLDRTKSATEH